MTWPVPIWTDASARIRIVGDGFVGLIGCIGFIGDSYNLLLTNEQFDYFFNDFSMPSFRTISEFSL